MAILRVIGLAAGLTVTGTLTGTRTGSRAGTRTGTRITRDDLEAKLRDMAGDLDDTVETARPTLLAGAAAVAVLVVLVAYLLGRRSGRARSAVVEIRKV